MRTAPAVLVPTTEAGTAPARRAPTTGMSGARVLVTGASLGIGRAIAFGFAAERARLALTYLETEAKAVAEQCRDLGAPAVTLHRLDLGDERSIRTCAGEVVSILGGLDILGDNAGVVWRRFLEQTSAEIDLQVRVNLLGTIKLTHLLLPHVRDAVIVIGSTASLHGTATLSAYGASQWGVRGWAKALAREQPDKRIVLVHPLVTATRMNDFRSLPPERVAEVVLMVARGELDLELGADVDVRDLVRAP
ncbi:MAG TPA: SDR family oxidoreductase [Thermoleophilia bacterium]|nr:SDR family oxidoreductase [Thermoleophilia bacterium]